MDALNWSHVYLANIRSYLKRRINNQLNNSFDFGNFRECSQVLAAYSANLHIVLHGFNILDVLTSRCARSARLRRLARERPGHPARGRPGRTAARAPSGRTPLRRAPG